MTVVATGRILQLKCVGAQGQLQCTNVHVDPTVPIAERVGILRRLSASLADTYTCHCIVGGDFNFETGVEDRVDLRTGEAVGTAGTLGRTWNELFGQLTELYQPDPTRAPKLGGARHTAARIDRLYSSLHTATLSDKLVTVGVLDSPWRDGRCSDHAPVAARIQLRPRRCPGISAPIPRWVARHPAFTKLVQSNLVDPMPDDVWESLACVKSAI